MATNKANLSKFMEDISDLKTLTSENDKKALALKKRLIS
jgi:hypothetical protein